MIFLISDIPVSSMQFRNYNAEDVARLRGSVEWPRPPSVNLLAVTFYLLVVGLPIVKIWSLVPLLMSSHATLSQSLTASKLFELVRNLREQDRSTVTFGCLDNAQLTQMCRFAETIYVSGWQASSHHSVSKQLSHAASSSACALIIYDTASVKLQSVNEPGPDLADYPLDTVPRHVDRLFRAQQFHDRKQFENQWTTGKFEGGVDYLRPIVADGDTGHGGMTAVMRLTKLMVDAGAAGIHFEDQRHGAKKCGHMGGKVLVSTREHIDRLMAARLQCDILGSETVVVARTDAEAAKLIESNQDPR